MSTPIPKLVLDNETDDEFLLDQAIVRTQAASNGQLTDWSVGSVARALLEGNVFSVAELKYYLNLLPEALALEVFRLAGISRKDGTVARGSLVFLLEAPLSTDFVVNSGYSIPHRDGFYVLTKQLVIPSGSLEGRATVAATQVGSAMNAPAFSLVLSNPGLNYLSAIYNDEPITGGSDLEPLESTVSRAQTELRSRMVLISKADYEEAAQQLIGAGSKAMCVPLLASNKEDYQPGQVHLFLADTLGQPANKGMCLSIQSELSMRSFVASSVWVSPIELEPISVELVVTCTEVSEVLAITVADRLREYFSPRNYMIGSTIRTSELVYLVRSIQGITGIDTCLLNGEAVNFPLPHLWSNPELEVLSISMVQPDGISQTYDIGVSVGDTV